MIWCEECGIGRCWQVHAPYLGQINGKRSLVPNVPAWQCDVCGQMRYDSTFIYYLHLLIEHGNHDGQPKKQPFKGASSKYWSGSRRST